MVWENKEFNDKNLESMRNEFGIENIMSSRIITDDNEISNLSTDLKEGQFRMVYTGGVLYKYTKYDGNMYRHTYTAV